MSVQFSRDQLLGRLKDTNLGLTQSKGLKEREPMGKANAPINAQPANFGHANERADGQGGFAPYNL